MRKTPAPILSLLVLATLAYSTSQAAASAQTSTWASDSAFQLLLGADPSRSPSTPRSIAPAPRSVAEATEDVEERGSWYLRVGGSWILDHETDFEIGAVSGTATGDSAFGIRAGLGVRINSVLSLELDFGYTKLDYDPFEYSGITPVFGNPFSGTVVGDLEYITTMFGPRLDFEIVNGLYVNGAATIGLAYGSATLTGTETLLGSTYAIDGSGIGGAFAYGLRAGLEWAITPNIAIYGGVRYEGSTTMAIDFDLYTSTSDSSLTPRMLGVDFGINITF